MDNLSSRICFVPGKQLSVVLSVGFGLSGVKTVLFVTLCRDGMYEPVCIKCTLLLAYLSLCHRQTETSKLSLSEILNNF